MATETPGADNPAATDIPDSIDLKPEEAAPTPEPPPVKPKHVKKGRAVAGPGAVIYGKDGVYVKFKKKCTVCSHEDSSRTSLKITNGVTRLNFYCPKCRKSHEAKATELGVAGPAAACRACVFGSAGASPSRFPSIGRAGPSNGYLS